MSVMTEQHRDLSTSRSAILRYQKIIEAQGNWLLPIMVWDSLLSTKVI